MHRLVSSTGRGVRPPGYQRRPGAPAAAARPLTPRKLSPTRVSKQKKPLRGSKKPISILLIDDNRLFRIGLSALLKRQAGLRLLAASKRPEDVARLGRLQRPDIVLLDLGLSGKGSLDVSQGLRAAYPEARLIVMGLIPLESEILAFVKQGVSGFLLKDASIHDFVAAIRNVAAGGRVFPSSLTDSLLSQIVADAARRGKVRMGDVKLTAREREIADLIADGLGNKAIGDKLNIAIDTVKSHVHSILEKLAVRSRVDIVLQGRVPPPVAR